MIDAFLAYFLVTLIPIAFPLSLRPATEHALFGAWRVVQLIALALAFAYVGVALVRARWIDRLLTLALVIGLAYCALSYAYIEFDAQIEYHRVLLLADRYHGLWSGYRHGVSGWILGYPPGTSLSIMWYRWLHIPSPNMAHELLVILWFVPFMTRYLRHVGAAPKILFVALLFTAPLFQWHLTFFYNNLFYALIWSQLVLLPLFGVEQRPWERCASALVLIWLRPQYQLAMLPIVSGALAMLLSGRLRDWRRVRDITLTTVAALLVIWLAAGYWLRTGARLGHDLVAENEHVEQTVAAQQDQHMLHIDIDSAPIPRPPTPAVAPLFSHHSAHAVYWAWVVTMESYSLGMMFLGAASLLALISLRRRGLPFLVPLLSPVGIIVGSALFARTHSDYATNSWAVERMQIIVPILAAGVAAALHHRLASDATTASDSNGGER